MIVELSKSLPVEVNNSTIELHLPVDSQYSLPVEALNLIVKSKSIKHRAGCHCLSRHARTVRRLLTRGIIICMSRTSRM